MWNVVTDPNSQVDGMYKNNVKNQKVPVSSYSDNYYITLPNDVYVNKSGYGYFSKKPEAFNIREEFVGFKATNEDIIENVFIGGTDDAQHVMYLKSTSLIDEFCYVFIARNGNAFLLSKSQIESQDGDLFVAKTIQDITNIREIEQYEFLEDNGSDGVKKGDIYTVATIREGTKKILSQENFKNG